MSRIVIFTCKECHKQTQVIQQALGEPPFFYLTHTCPECKHKLYQKCQQLLKEKAEKEKLKKIQAELWKASHCAACDKEFSVYHYVCDKNRKPFAFAQLTV